jgi:hypothetical protein
MRVSRTTSRLHGVPSAMEPRAPSMRSMGGAPELMCRSDAPRNSTSRSAASRSPVAWAGAGASTSNTESAEGGSNAGTRNAAAGGGAEESAEASGCASAETS